MNDVEWGMDLQCGMKLWSFGYRELDWENLGSD